MYSYVSREIIGPQVKVDYNLLPQRDNYWEFRVYLSKIINGLGNLPPALAETPSSTDLSTFRDKLINHYKFCVAHVTREVHDLNLARLNPDIEFAERTKQLRHMKKVVSAAWRHLMIHHNFELNLSRHRFQTQVQTIDKIYEDLECYK